MNMSIPLIALVLHATPSLAAESRHVTYYSDGAVIEPDEIATKGFIEIPLPAGMLDGSLRIRPARGTAIQRVDLVTARKDSDKGEKGLDVLLEQRSRLGDRLLVLETREEIFYLLNFRTDIIGGNAFVHKA